MFLNMGENLASPLEVILFLIIINTVNMHSGCFRNEETEPLDHLRSETVSSPCLPLRDHVPVCRSVSAICVTLAGCAANVCHW